jgi:Recombination endonuclease VII
MVKRKRVRVRDLVANKFYFLKFLYGLTLDGYHALLEKQNEQCAICRKTLEPLSKSTHVDHNHRTKKVRGLLCGTCNIGIGAFYESPAALREAATYLEENDT